MPGRKKIIFLFFALFLFRLFFGLQQSHWADYDERQSYLTGLKFYTTGAWPAFGPDAAGSESSYYSQIPGALEGLVIGLPLYALPIPEAPFILVNLLSAGGIFLLAWYIHRRLPRLSFLWLCLWIAVAPWSINYPSHISNMSYLFFSGILFFIGFLESVPLFSLEVIPLPWANTFMGFSLFWCMQFHLSYTFLVPFAAFSMVTQLKDRPRLRPLFFFLLGALAPFSFALPTYLQYGFSRINSHSGFFTLLNWNNILSPHILLARFLSLGCFEVPSFIGAHTADRIHFLLSHPGILLPGAFLWIGGILQALALLFSWFKKGSEVPGWKEMKWLLAAAFGVVYGSFWFTIKPPLSHIYLIFFPLIMIYSCYVWNFFAGDPRLRRLAKIFVVLGVCFQLGYAMAVEPKDSVWAQRSLIAKAIAEKNYHVVGERSPGSLY